MIGITTLFWGFGFTSPSEFMIIAELWEESIPFTTASTFNGVWP